MDKPFQLFVKTVLVANSNDLTILLSADSELSSQFNLATFYSIFKSHKAFGSPVTNILSLYSLSSLKRTSFNYRNMSDIISAYF